MEGDDRNKADAMISSVATMVLIQSRLLIIEKFRKRIAVRQNKVGIKDGDEEGKRRRGQPALSA